MIEIEDILKYVLSLYVLFGYFIPHININKNIFNGLLLFSIFSIFIAAYYDFVLSMLIIIAMIIFISKSTDIVSVNENKTESSKKKKNKNEFKKIDQQQMKRLVIQNEEELMKKYDEPVVVNFKKCTTSKRLGTNQLEQTKSNKAMIKSLENIQSNMFNTMNQNLYYNELGDQMNIQGVDDTLQGYDQNIYTL